MAAEKMYLVLDTSGVVKFKSDDVSAAKAYALVNTGRVVAFGAGEGVAVRVCSRCRGRLSNGVCPTGCEVR